MTRYGVSRRVPARLCLALVDGLFASALSVFGYHSTVTRLWEGVASTVIGPSAFDGGLRTTLVGIIMHIGVALAWTIVFVLLVNGLPRLRRTAATPSGLVVVAAFYGPAIWMVMSLLVIPSLTGRPPTITGRWWLQLAAHIPFVALPIVTVIGRGLRADARVGEARR